LSVGKPLILYLEARALLDSRVMSIAAKAIELGLSDAAASLNSGASFLQ